MAYVLDDGWMLEEPAPYEVCEDFDLLVPDEEEEEEEEEEVTVRSRIEAWPPTQYAPPPQGGQVWWQATDDGRPVTRSPPVVGPSVRQRVEEWEKVAAPFYQRKSRRQDSQSFGGAAPQGTRFLGDGEGRRWASQPLSPWPPQQPPPSPQRSFNRSASAVGYPHRISPSAAESRIRSPRATSMSANMNLQRRSVSANDAFGGRREPEKWEAEKVFPTIQKSIVRRKIIPQNAKRRLDFMHDIDENDYTSSKVDAFTFPEKYKRVPSFVIVAKYIDENFFWAIIDMYFKYGHWCDFEDLPDSFKEACDLFGVGPDSFEDMPGFAPKWLYIVKKIDNEAFTSAVNYFFNEGKLPSWNYLPESFISAFREMDITEWEYF